MLKMIKPYMWVLIVGGIATYFVYKTQKAYVWVAGVGTAILAYLAFRKWG